MTTSAAPRECAARSRLAPAKSPLRNRAAALAAGPEAKNGSSQRPSNATGAAWVSAGAGSPVAGAASWSSSSSPAASAATSGWGHEQEEQAGQE